MEKSFSVEYVIYPVKHNFTPGHLTSKSVNRTLENINMQINDLNIRKYCNSKKVPLVRFRSTTGYILIIQIAFCKHLFDVEHDK